MKTPNTKTLMTPWAQDIPETPWDIYPRPQLVRDSYLTLNGKWSLSTDEGEPVDILVPFPPESVLSGGGIHPKNNAKLTYQKVFTLPCGFVKGRVLLHFGAVDQVATVSLNGQEVGTHHGGYTAFTFDITPYLAEENHLEVVVHDDLDSHVLPWGKQRYDRGGMWYTPISGIWQSVWLESVPETYITGIRIEPTLTSCTIRVSGVTDGTLTLDEDGETYPITDGVCSVTPKTPHLWTPEDPYLYHFTIESGEDHISSYFALRTLSTKVVNGLPRLCLNDTPYFFHGVLDQGYFSDGIYTPATPDAYTQDILSMKALGFNTLRKHIKVEPEHFYYECDRLGMVVFQDMVNNGDYSFFRDTALPTIGIQKLSDKRLHRDPVTRGAFLTGMVATVNQLYNHPSICYWTIFNEGWGQFDSQRMYESLLKLDSSRIIDTTSGWFRCSESQVESLHIYFRKVKLKKSPLPLVLSEFGGYSYKLPDHSFNLSKTYGYRFFKEEAPFRQAVDTLYREEIIPAIKEGLCGTIYTQLSDVEDETNGLITYDRKVVKVSKAEMQEMASALFTAFAETIQ